MNDSIRKSLFIIFFAIVGLVFTTTAPFTEHFYKSPILAPLIYSVLYIILFWFLVGLTDSVAKRLNKNAKLEDNKTYSEILIIGTFVLPLGMLLSSLLLDYDFRLTLLEKVLPYERSEIVQMLNFSDEEKGDSTEKGIASPSKPAPQFDVSSYSDSMFVTADGKVNIRSGPGTNYDKIGSASNGNWVTATGKATNADWYRVSMQKGPGGFIHGSLLKSKHIIDEEKQAEKDYENELKRLKEEVRVVERRKDLLEMASRFRWRDCDYPDEYTKLQIKMFSGCIKSKSRQNRENLERIVESAGGDFTPDGYSGYSYRGVSKKYSDIVKLVAEEFQDSKDRMESIYYDVKRDLKKGRKRPRHIQPEVSGWEQAISSMAKAVDEQYEAQRRRQGGEYRNGTFVPYDQLPDVIARSTHEEIERMFANAEIMAKLAQEKQKKTKAQARKAAHVSKGQSGYTFFSVSSCDDRIKKQYDTTCAHVVSQLMHISGCEDPHLAGACDSWNFSTYVNNNISNAFSRIKGRVVYPNTDKSKMERERVKFIREARRSEATVKQIHWLRQNKLP